MLRFVPRVVRICSFPLRQCGSDSASCSNTGNWFPREPPANEAIETKRARLHYQSKKRGILENDLLLGGFADSYLRNLSTSQLDAYDYLINGGHNEWDIYYWISGTTQVPSHIDGSLMKSLQDFAASSGKIYWHKKNILAGKKNTP